MIIGLRTFQGAVAGATLPMARSAALWVIFPAVLALSAPAGTLEDAPFRLTLPAGDWQFEGTDPIRDRSINLVRIAYATNSTGLRTLVMRHELQETTGDPLEQLAGTMYTTLTTNQVKVTMTATNFVGHPARLLVYEMTIPNETAYTEAILLVTGDAGWTIAAMGPAGREAEIKQILSFYSTK